MSAGVIPFHQDELPRGERRAAAPAETPSFETVALVPARNEEEGIFVALYSLARQTRRPDLILVVVNNSSDATFELAQEFAADPESPHTVVLNLEDNPHKKAGALNYGLRWLEWGVYGKLGGAVKYVIVMDADTKLHPEFIERAHNVLQSDPKLGGVSAACLGRHNLWRSQWQRYLLGMQVIEYGRAANARYKRNVHTMSGAGSFYRGEALQSLIDGRGMVFWEDHRNLVEDYETTLALKETGWKVTANQFCLAYTDLMPTLRQLIQQRERWARGTVDTMRARGVTEHTWYSIMTLCGAMLGAFYVLGCGIMQMYLWSRYGFHPAPIYWLLIAFWAIYPALRVTRLGPKAMLVEALMLPELFYTVLRTYWLSSSLVKSYFTRVKTWK